MYFQFAHLLFSTVAVAVSATRQLLSGIDDFPSGDRIKVFDNLNCDRHD
jgi:hypothetical protein